MKNNQPLVSVIMNCYNSDTYLKEAINSVISQTYTNWEIIFWDNQSIDKSAEIVKSYDDERIRYFYAPFHTLLGEARNLAVNKAAGEWIAFLDCDDVWYEKKLDIQLKNISNNIGMIYSRMEFLIETSGIKTNMAKNIINKIYPKRKDLPLNDIFDKLLFECFIPLPSVLIRRNLFEKVGGIDNSLKVAEDYDIFLKVSKVSKVKAINDVLCKYRVHENNLSHSNENITFTESIEIISKYNKLNNNNIKKAIAFWKIKMLYTLNKGSLLNFFYYLINVIYYKYKKLL